MAPMTVSFWPGVEVPMPRLPLLSKRAHSVTMLLPELAAFDCPKKVPPGPPPFWLSSQVSPCAPLRFHCR